MGVKHLFPGAVLWLALLFLTLAGSSAVAAPLALAPRACAGGAATAEQAFALPPPSLDCGQGRFNGRNRFLRARIDLSAVVLPPGRLVWQTASSRYDSMLIRATYGNGTQALIDVDSQMAVRNWLADGTFWVTLQQAGQTLKLIDVVVERPRSSAILREMTLARAEDAMANSFRLALLYALLCGILLVPIVYDMFIARILRERFMAWHVWIAGGALLFILSQSNLLLLLFPDMPSRTRFAASFIAVSLILLGSVRFSVEILEEGMVGRRLSNASTWGALGALALSLALLLDLEVLRLRVIGLFLALATLLLVALALIIGQALARGSRSAKFLAAAYLAPAVAGVLRIAGEWGWLDGTDRLDEALYFALVALILGTAASVGDRFLILKAERDRARITARKLGAMANSDGLTGLPNRRAFDQHRKLAPGHALLVGDLDRFKYINDSFGHQRGDAVLCRAARSIESVIARRGEGTVFRLGGEEFAVLCRAKTASEVGDVCEAIRSEVAAGSDMVPLEDLPPATISIGAVLGTGQLMHVAFAEADEALYRAKESGRDRWELAGP